MSLKVWIKKRKEAKKKKLLDEYIKKTTELEQIKKEHKSIKEAFDAKKDLKKKKAELKRLKKETRQMKLDPYVRVLKAIFKRKL